MSEGADADESGAVHATVPITVNGEARRVPVGCTVEELVRSLGLEPRAVAVEVDRALVPRAERAARVLAAEQAVEVVTLVGGG